MNAFTALSRRMPSLLGRCSRSVESVYCFRNWPAAVAAEWSRRPLERLRLREGVRLVGPNDDLGFLFHEIWMRKVYTPPGYEIRPGHVVVDVGANIGVFSVFAATRAPGVRVLAFEPVPANLDWLNRNIALNGLTTVTVLARAVSGTSDRRLMYLDPLPDAHSLHPRPGGGETMLVDCVSLDEALAGEERVDLLKLDCEGAEFQILPAASRKTMARICRIAVEIHEGPRVRRAGEELVRLLIDRGFRLDGFQRTAVGGHLYAANDRPP